MSQNMPQGKIIKFIQNRLNFFEIQLLCIVSHIDYDNFVYEEEDDDIETIKDLNVEVEEGEDIDYSEELEAENHFLSSDDIIPGLVGWVQYAGQYKPAKVISRNKRKKTAFVKNYTAEGLQKKKQIVNMTDIRPFQHNFNEFTIGENEEHFFKSKL